MSRNDEEPLEKVRTGQRCSGGSVLAGLGLGSADAVHSAREVDMKKRANLGPLRIAGSAPIKRISDFDDGYRVATDALIAAADLGCSDEILEALWNICVREAGCGANAAASE